MARREIDAMRAIVTGASSGIGWEMARQLALADADVVATARRAERLDLLAEQLAAEHGKTLRTVSGDLTSAELRSRLIETVGNELGGLDLLVNNAGVGARGLFEDADPERVRKIFEINFFAPVEMIRVAIPLLKEGRQPMIVNISSIFGRRAMPFSSEYCASKFALHGFSEALRAELSIHAIDVLVVNPGTTATEFADRLIEQTERPSWRSPEPVSASMVAERALQAIRAGKHEITPHRPGRLLCAMNRLSPRLVDWIAARSLTKRNRG